jgi:hypothetical protein
MAVWCILIRPCRLVNRYYQQHLLTRDADGVHPQIKGALACTLNPGYSIAENRS